MSSPGVGGDVDGFAVVGELHHRYLTGVLLAAVTRAGRGRAAEVVFRTFRRQHLEKFLPGLEKLGLRDLPPAVACARYHHLSNVLGGVQVAWIPESDRKSWVRYRPPRWIFDGTAVCGIPTEVSRAMLRGWHAHNGVSLGNPRLGFVCTKLTTDAQPGLEGYYVEEDRDLDPDERLRFAPGEQAPAAGAESAPWLDEVAWPPARLQKVARNYALEYVRSILPELVAVLGPADGGHLGRTAGRQVGMQYHDAVVARLRGEEPSGPASLARLLARLAVAAGEDAQGEMAPGGAEARVRQRGWRLARGLHLPPEAFDAWNGLWEGLAAVHGPGLRLDLVERLDLGDDAFEWRIRPRRAPTPY